jgi:hypothetical protein
MHLGYILFFGSNGIVWNRNLLFKRKNYQDQKKARGISVVIAVALIIAAFIGNIQLNIDSFYTFYNI